MKKKGIIVIGVILFIIGVCVGLFFYLNSSIGPKNDIREFVVEAGSNKMEIASKLEKEGFIRNKYATLAYIFFQPNLNLQAGTYRIDKGLSAFDIIKQIAKGDTKQVAKTIKITFKEGLMLVDYANLVEEYLNISASDFINKTKDKEYLNTLIEKYAFLTTDILNDKIYMPLEGYLAPATYEFYENSTVENVIEKMLDNMSKWLKKYDFSNSKYNIHQTLVFASIIEREARTFEDRQKVSQVFASRMSKGQTLGSDVTAWYGYTKGLSSKVRDEKAAIQQSNGYNTRMEADPDLIGLPVGAICNPGQTSIDAVFSPSDTNYLFFVASVNTGKMFFYETYNEFTQNKDKDMASK